jgi:hypothetical protein
VKIRYTAASPKAGIEEHLNNQTAATLIAAGFAVHVPYKSFVEFMNAEHRQGSDSNNVNPPQVQGVQWSCSTKTNGRPIIFRKSGGETARIEDEQQAIQYGAPESVLKQFRELVAVQGVNAAEAARPEQVKREAEEKLGTWQAIYRRA